MINKNLFGKFIFYKFYLFVDELFLKIDLKFDFIIIYY